MLIFSAICVDMDMYDFKMSRRIFTQISSFQLQASTAAPLVYLGYDSATYDLRQDENMCGPSSHWLCHAAVQHTPLANTAVQCTCGVTRLVDHSVDLYRLSRLITDAGR